jgi:predicted RNase H-like nuclease (RuvC/YqgF family)
MKKNNKIYEQYDLIVKYCDANNITDIENFIFRCFKQGFDIQRYGLLGETNENTNVVVEKEVIKEIVKEVPVEVIKEVYITDDKQITSLLEKIQEIEKLTSKKDEELSELRQTLDEKNLEIEKINNKMFIFVSENEGLFEKEMSKKDKELDELKQKISEKNGDDKVKMLQDTLQKLRNELQIKNQQIIELEKINKNNLNGVDNQGHLLRGSNLK